jgi:hypothetical protein
MSQATITTEPAPLDISFPEAPTGTREVPVGYTTTFNWDYREQMPDLRNLYGKGKRSQWDVDTKLDWSIDVDPESENTPNELLPIFGTRLWDRLDKKRELPKLRRLMTGWVLSNFLHGEQGALFAAAQLVCAAPNTDAKLYAATQAMDEARHVEAYDRYLREKIETTFPISPHLSQLLDEILREPRWDMKYLGMQIMVEGLALASFGMIMQTTNEPLLRDIVTMIHQDEARHVAFGVIALKGTYDEMSEAELRDREDFIVDASRLMHDRFMFEEVWQHMGMPVDECIEAVKQSESQKMFRQLLFSKIVPNVKRLGLLTPRVREGFQELGVIQYEDWEATA